MSYTNVGLPIEFRDFNGYVEIEFIDPTTNERKSLRRLINNKQIEYYLNGVQAERIVVKNFLMFMGFSRSFPFEYRVRCRDIDKMMASTMEIRLEWLQDCCGLGEYKESKEKSLSILNETNDEIDRIKVALWKIDAHIDIFASQEQQTIYQNWLKREHDLGHFQRKYRMENLQREIEKCNADITICSELIAKYGNEIIQSASNMRLVQSAIKSNVQNINSLESRRFHTNQRIDKLKNQKMTLDTSISKLRSTLQCARFAEEISMQEKRLLRQSIDQSESEINGLRGVLDKLKTVNGDVELKIGGLESNLETIHAKSAQNQRLNTHFLSIAQRNSFILENVKKAATAISRENRNIKKCKNDIEQNSITLEDLKKSKAEKQQEFEQRNANNNETNLRNLRKAHSDLLTQLRYESNHSCCFFYIKLY